MRAALACLVLLCGAVISSAAQADPLARAQDAFQGWLEEVGTSGVLTVFRDGVHQATFAEGMAADAPVELASLSKAITAVCALDLVVEGVWTLETSAQDVLGMGGAVTLAQLMTHRSGLGPDRTQGLRGAFLPIARARAPGVGAHALERGASETRAAGFDYNNENYAVLGDMIAAQTGESYATACQRRALDPAGVTGIASPVVGPMLAWGGWTMSVADYAAFHFHWFGPEGEIGRAPEVWPQHKFDDAGIFYGPGMFQRPMRGTHNFWHFGSHCFPGQLNVGAFSVSWFGAWSAVAAYEACIDWDQSLALDRTLSASILGLGE